MISKLQYQEEYDVIVAGSGVGGLSAAITAAHRGARVLLLEKFDKLGGVTALSAGVLWTGPNIVSERTGIKDSIEDAQTYMNTLTRGLAKENLKSNYLTGSREAVEFFVDKIGVELEVQRGVPDYFYPKLKGTVREGRFLEAKPFPAKKLGEWKDKVLVSPYGTSYSYGTGTDFVAFKEGRGDYVETITRHIENDERCGGAGLSAALVYAALQLNVEFRVSTAMAELLVEDGRVSGVLAKPTDSSQSPYTVRALKGVLMAVGGYDWRKDLMRSFDGLREAHTMVPPTITGDHLTMAAKVGAIGIPARLPGQSPIFVGYRVPGETIFGHPSSRLLLPGAPHSIVVNHKGKRFANDAFYLDVVLNVTRFNGTDGGMPNWPAYLVFDQNMLQKSGLAPTLPGGTLPEGLAKQADSIEELAKITGIDAQGLSETIQRYNGFCKDGKDPDFDRGTFLWTAIVTGDLKLPNPNMAEISTGPFYAVELVHVGLGAGTTGLPIDGEGRVLTSSDEPIPGLYACGNSASWQDWGGGYTSGVAGMRGMMYGYRASLDMTKDPGPKI